MSSAALKVRQLAILSIKGIALGISSLLLSCVFTAALAVTLYGVLVLGSGKHFSPGTCFICLAAWIVLFPMLALFNAGIGEPYTRSAALTALAIFVGYALVWIAYAGYSYETEPVSRAKLARELRRVDVIKATLPGDAHLSRKEWSTLQDVDDPPTRIQLGSYIRVLKKIARHKEGYSPRDAERDGFIIFTAPEQ